MDTSGAKHGFFAGAGRSRREDASFCFSLWPECVKIAAIETQEDSVCRRKKRGRTHSRWLLPAALVLAGAAWFENFTLSTSTVTAACAALPEAFSGLRIVQISDLHGRRFDAESRYLLELVRLQSPDLIALTGDLADEFTDFSMLPPLLDGLTALAPTFYVTGNHEWVLSREKREVLFSMLDAAGVVRLQNEYRLLKKGAGLHRPGRGRRPERPV